MMDGRVWRAAYKCGLIVCNASQSGADSGMIWTGDSQKQSSNKVNFVWTSFILKQQPWLGSLEATL